MGHCCRELLCMYVLILPDKQAISGIAVSREIYYVMRSGSEKHGLPITALVNKPSLG